MSISRILMAASFLTLAACSDRQPAVSEKHSPKDHVFQGQADALGKAKGVEQTLQDAATQQRITIERQEQ